MRSQTNKWDCKATLENADKNNFRKAFEFIIDEPRRSSLSCASGPKKSTSTSSATQTDRWLAGTPVQISLLWRRREQRTEPHQVGGDILSFLSCAFWRGALFNASSIFCQAQGVQGGGGSQPPVLCSAAAWVVSSWRPMTTLFLIAQRRGTEDLSSIPTLLVANPFQGRFIPEM